MSNTLNSIHYAVEIITDYDGSIGSIGMNDTGIIRYTTDGYNPITNNATYEDGSVVSGTWSGEFLTKKGIKPSKQSIDIIAGGDYAYLGSFNIEIANINGLHKIILGTDGLHIVGSIVKFYVVVDDVFYNRGVFSVSEYDFNDKAFTYKCKDKHIVDNNTIEDVVFGDSNIKLEPIIEDEEAFLQKLIINNAKPVNDRVVCLIPDWDNSGESLTDKIKATAKNEFIGMGPLSKVSYIDTNAEYYVLLNGTYNNISVGMYLKFDDSDTLYPIMSIDTIEPDITRLKVKDVSSKLKSYTQMYGEQYKNDSIIDEVLDFMFVSSNKITVSIYKYGNKVKIDGITLLKTDDGKYIAEDEDGDIVYIEGYEEDDYLIITSTNVLKHKIPKKIKYWTETQEDHEFFDKLLEGKINHLELYGTEVIAPEELTFNNNPTFTVKDKYIYITIEFDESVNDWTPFVSMSSALHQNELWSYLYWPYNGVSASKYSALIEYGWLPEGIDSNLYPTQDINKGEIRDYEGRSKSMFTAWNCNVHKVVTDNKYGDIPLYDSNADIIDFDIMNTFSSYNREFGEIHETTGPGVYKFMMSQEIMSNICTNLPVNYENVYSTFTKPLEFKNQALDDISDLLYYPERRTSFVDNPSNVNIETKKLLFVIEPTMNPKENDSDPDDYKGFSIITVLSDSGTGRLTDSIESVYNYDDNISLEIHNTLTSIFNIGVYKYSVLDNINNIKFKAINSSTDTYNKLINNLAKTNHSFINRDNWYVGAQITEKINTFDIITTLCKQGFVAGFTDRLGNIQFKQFLETTEQPLTHDDDLILDKTIKNFKLSSISKCYNEFTIKYHYNGDDYEKEIGIYHVDEDEFPEQTIYEPIEENGTSTINITYGGVEEIHIIPGVDFIVKPPLGSLIKFTIYPGTPNEHTYYGEFIMYHSGTDEMRFRVSEDVGFGFSYDMPMNDLLWSISGSEKWREFVSGIDDYNTSKELWEKAHVAYLLNKRKRQAPSDRSELRYAIDISTFYNNEVPDNILYGFFIEYAYNYVRMFVDWTTRQKLQVSYSLPITDENIKIDLMNDIQFNDPIITPDPGEYGKGWITKIGIDTIKDKIDVEITFEPDFLSQPILPGCGKITEIGTQYPVDNIIEDENNTDNIVEGDCDINV